MTNITRDKEKIVILGGNGMLGHVLALYLDRYFEVICILRRKIPFIKHSIQYDFIDLDGLVSLIDQINPIAVINTLGVLISESKKNPEIAVKINSLVPIFLAKKYNSSKLKIIQVSSDCVFNGLSGPYQVDSAPDSFEIYGMTKYLGEIHNSKDLTIRTSIIGPEITPLGAGLFNWIMNETGIVKGYNNVHWNGVTSLQISKFIKHAIQDNISGLVHFTSSHSITKHDLLIMINDFFRKEKVRITKSSGLKSNKFLEPSFDSDYYEIPNYVEMISEMKTWVLDNPKIYQHYIKKMSL